MKQESFVREREPRWQELEARLGGKLGVEGAEKLPVLLRAVSHDLAVAREHRFDAPLVERLNRLVLAAHHKLYRAPVASWRRWWEFWTFDFPRAVREEWRLVVLSHVLFYGSALAVGWWLLKEPEGIFTILPPGHVRTMERMYDPNGPHFLKPRSFDSDTVMFGFYIYNNISIAFRAFASGIFAGIGAGVSVFYNGVFLGAVAAHLGRLGFGMNLLQFVIGHGSLELTALVMSGAAGMRLGWSVVAPGRYSRAHALRRAARKAVPIVYGCAGMLLAAAAVEAYWSSSLFIDRNIKLAVGALGWLCIAAYFLLGGREREARAS